MRKCPKHPNEIQTGPRCMVWIGGDTMRCMEPTQPLSTEELLNVQREILHDQLTKTTLPQWVINAIKEIVYELGHAIGESEVNGQLLEYLYIFEKYQQKI